MRPDPALMPPKKNRALSVAEARSDEMLITICGDLFAAGFSTFDMKQRLHLPEAACLAALHVARERQRSAA
jgi:hypothetical protein